ncbi:MAG: glycosyltransferase [Proteobacteria bacterium]|nr:glycosyltransferase [Pseudomonadota bacterium]NOG60711.1 glycosyltransferase [Pseudomonadota bacterium]
MKPTILQILPELDCGGVERGTLEVAAELVRRGHRSIVVSGTGQMVPQLIAEGSEHINLPVGKKSLFTAIRLIPRLRQLFKEQQINIIHARSRLPAWLAYLAWKKLDPENRPRFITTVHGPYTVNRYSKIMVSGERIIAVSEYIKNYILKNYPDVNENKIETIHRGISKEKFPYGFNASGEWLSKWKRDHPNLSDKFIITLPGRITRWKGHNDFIDIIIKAKNDGLNVHGIFAGGTDPGKDKYLNELKSIIDTNGMNDYFTFLGQRNDMKEIISSSDIVLSLAITPEAFGRTALEALSLGVPVIAYDHGGAKEILAKMFPEGRATPLDTDDVNSLIKKFHSSMPEVKNQVAFSLNNMLDKTISCYNSFS